MKVELEEVRRELEKVNAVICKDDKYGILAVLGSKVSRIDTGRRSSASSPLFGEYKELPTGHWMSTYKPKNIKIGGIIDFASINLGGFHGHGLDFESKAIFKTAQIKPDLTGYVFSEDGGDLIRLNDGTIFVPTKGSEIIHNIPNIEDLGNAPLKKPSTENGLRYSELPTNKTKKVLVTKYYDEYKSPYKFLFVEDLEKKEASTGGYGDDYDLGDWLEY